MSKFHKENEKETVVWGSFWGTASIILHLVIIGVLTYVSPVRQWIFGEHEPVDMPVSSAELKKFLDKFLETETREVMRQLTQHKELTTELENIRQRVFLALNTMQQRRPPSSPSLGNPSDMGPISPEWNLPLDGRNIPQLHGISRKMEEAAFGISRQIRTVDLARIQRVSIGEAFAVMRLAVPNRREADAAAFNLVITSRDDPAFLRLKEEIGRIRVEIGDMIASTQQLLDMARGIVGDDVGAIVGLPQSGMAGVTAHASDSEGSDRDDDPFVDYSPPEPDAFTHHWGRGVGPITQRDEIFPRQLSASLGSLRPAPGRKLIQGQGEYSPSGWMYLDTWYIIGPFDNPNREKIDHPFPPETAMKTGLNLDSVYVGQANRSISWQFTRSPEVCIIPHYPRDWAIWYAYTEVYSDRDQERWCIFGSDDYGKAWVNGEPVYGSGKTPHPWIPDRAYKKVKFRKGYNAVLFKLENAWGRTGFSMCIYLGETN